MDLVEYTDTASLLTHIDQNTGAVFGDHPQGILQLRSAVAAQRTENISGKAFTVNADKYIFFIADIAASDCKIFKVVHFGAVRGDDEFSETGGKFCTFSTDDQLFMAAAVGDQLSSRPRNGTWGGS